MLRHDDIADQAECILHANPVEPLHKAVAGIYGSKQRAAIYATERDEVKIALTVAAFKWVAHRIKTRTLEIHKGAAPQPPISKRYCANDILTKCFARTRNWQAAPFAASYPLLWVSHFCFGPPSRHTFKALVFIRITT